MPTSPDTLTSNATFDGKEVYTVYVSSRHTYHVTCDGVDAAKELAEQRYKTRNAFGEYDKITNIMVVTK